MNQNWDLRWRDEVREMCLQRSLPESEGGDRYREGLPEVYSFVQGFQLCQDEGVHKATMKYLKEHADREPSNTVPEFHQLPPGLQAVIAYQFYSSRHRIGEERSSIEDFVSRPRFKYKEAGFGTYFIVNGEPYMLPLTTDEFGVIQGATYGAKLCYPTGGFQAEVDHNYPKAIGQTLFLRPKKKNPEKLIQKNKAKILKRASEGHRFSKAYDVATKTVNGDLVVELRIDPGNAMGAEIACEMMDSVAHYVKDLIGAESYTGNIVSNSSGRLVRVRAHARLSTLARKDPYSDKKWSGEEVAEGIERLCVWANQDRDRAVTHNKGITNGVICLATPFEQDSRAIEAAAHGYASRDGRYMPLSRWVRQGDELHGELEVPIPCSAKRFKNYNFMVGLIEDDNNYDLLPPDSADKFAHLLGSVGLATNLSALSMLATIGVRKAHARAKELESRRSLFVMEDPEEINEGKKSCREWALRDL